MSIDKLSGEKKVLLKMKDKSDKTNLELYRELGKKKKRENQLIKQIQSGGFPQSVLEVYYQRFLS